MAAIDELKFRDFRGPDDYQGIADVTIGSSSIIGSESTRPALGRRDLLRLVC